MDTSGYYVREGSYQGTNDDRLGRWYIGYHGQIFDPRGSGHATKADAWKALEENLSVNYD